MLLGAAQHLAETRAFRGTARFIFQPAEENEAGGRAMVEDGLFCPLSRSMRFTGCTTGRGCRWVAWRSRAGPMMASCDLFEITLTGRGCHAAMPHLGSDTVLASAAVTVALHALVGRAARRAGRGDVVGHSGACRRHLERVAGTALLSGTVRAFRESVQDTLEAAICETARSERRRTAVPPRCATTGVILRPSMMPRRHAGRRALRRWHWARMQSCMRPAPEHGI